MKDIIGVLSPDGKFYKCESYGHLSLAKELCKTLFNKEFLSGVKCEDYLLENGYIVFQTRHVYNGFFKITDEQFEFIKLHTDDFYVMQKEDINKLLLQRRDWSE